jgi:hypothetical protein
MKRLEIDANPDKNGDDHTTTSDTKSRRDVNQKLDITKPKEEKLILYQDSE